MLDNLTAEHKQVTSSNSEGQDAIARILGWAKWYTPASSIKRILAGGTPQHSIGVHPTTKEKMKNHKLVPMRPSEEILAVVRSAYGNATVYDVGHVWHEIYRRLPEVEPSTEVGHNLVYPGGGEALSRQLWHLVCNAVVDQTGVQASTNTMPMMELRAFIDHLCVLVDSPPQPVVGDTGSSHSTWFALVMNAAAELEDASNYVHDVDAKRSAIKGAAYYREAANKLLASRKN